MVNEKLIQSHMDKLGISREEAIQLIEDDKAIDKGAKLFELSAEQEKASKKARQTTGKVEKKAPTKREKKSDNEKLVLMSAFNEVLEQMEEVANIEKLNEERETTFTFNGRKFKITLSAPRK